MEIFLLDVIDVDAERSRLEAGLKKWRKDLEHIEKKIDNPRFVEKAPPEVVAEERRRLEAARREIALLETSLADLS